eukprot:SAG31_NODE_7173_length_1766_cov_2.685063_2_plen_242_part_00
MSGWYPGVWGFYRQCSSSHATSQRRRSALDGFVSRYRKLYCACCILLYQAALDPSGTSTNGFLDGRSCFASWGSSTAADYCTWHDRVENENFYGVLCGGCTASEEPSWFGSYDYLGCPMDSSHPSRVTYLSLGGCGLQGSLPWSLLGQLTRLQFLELGHNPDLTGTALSEDGLAALTQLRYLYLYGDTQLSGTVPAAALGGLAQLRYLELDGTQVGGAQCRSFCDAHASTVSDGCYCQLGR